MKQEGNESTTAFEHISKFKREGFILYDTMIFKSEITPKES